jgi:hypothetical protein
LARFFVDDPAGSPVQALSQGAYLVIPLLPLK